MTPHISRASAHARAAGPGDATDGRPDTPTDRSRTAADGGAWRGPSEGRWVARLLGGAPAPRDPAPSPPGAPRTAEGVVEPPRP